MKLDVGWLSQVHFSTITQISAPYLPMLSSYFCRFVTAENGCSQHPFRVHCTWFFNGGGISPVCAALMIYLSLPSFCYCFAMRSKGSPKSQETLKVEVFLLRGREKKPKEISKFALIRFAMNIDSRRIFSSPSKPAASIKKPNKQTPKPCSETNTTPT